MIGLGSFGTCVLLVTSVAQKYTVEAGITILGYGTRPANEPTQATPEEVLAGSSLFPEIDSGLPANGPESEGANKPLPGPAPEARPVPKPEALPPQTPPVAPAPGGVTSGGQPGPFGGTAGVQPAFGQPTERLGVGGPGMAPSPDGIGGDFVGRSRFGLGGPGASVFSEFSRGGGVGGEAFLSGGAPGGNGNLPSPEGPAPGAGPIEGIPEGPGGGGASEGAGGGGWDDFNYRGLARGRIPSGFEGFSTAEGEFGSRFGGGPSGETTGLEGEGGASGEPGGPRGAGGAGGAPQPSTHGPNIGGGQPAETPSPRRPSTSMGSRCRQPQCTRRRGFRVLTLNTRLVRRILKEEGFNNKDITYLLNPKLLQSTRGKGLAVVLARLAKIRRGSPFHRTRRLLATRFIRRFLKTERGARRVVISFRNRFRRSASPVSSSLEPF